MPGWIGPWEILLLLLVVLLVFGPKRVPELGRSLGRGMREFRSSLREMSIDKDDEEIEPAAEPTAGARERESVG
jgi:sec-independent protein translocase protein TatA